jgi:hypothetical protein
VINFYLLSGGIESPYYCSATNTWTAFGGSGTFNALTGDAVSTSTGGATTVKGINGTLLSGLGTGILKNTTTTGVPSIAVAADVYGLWSGTCSSSTYLRGDGACQTPSGSGTVTAEPQYDVTWYTQTGTVSQVGGSAISGFQFDSTSAGPTAATAANLGTLANLATNSIVYSAGTTSALAGVTPVNNAVVSTNGSGVPSESTTLPSGLSATNLTLITPALGTPASGVITNLTGTCASCVANSATLDLPLTGGTLTGALTGTSAAFSSGVSATSDGVHSGYISLIGNTANQAVTSNTTGFMGPSSASFTAYALQLPATGPTNSTPLLSCGTPSSAISTCTFVGGGGTVSSGNAGHITWYSSTGSTVSGDSNLDDGATTANTLTYAGSGGITASAGPIGSAPPSGDAGMMYLGGNTTNQTIPTHDFAIGGFSSTSATAYGWQPSTTAPSGTQFMTAGTPSSGWSAIGYVSSTGTGNVVLAASPALTGTPTAPTQSCASNTDIATDAYVANCASGSSTSASIWPISMGSTSQGSFGVGTAGTVYTWVIVNGPATAQKISYLDFQVSTDDTTSGHYYDIGIYGPCALGGTSCPLVADIGSGSQGVAITHTGQWDQAITQSSPVTLTAPAAGQYYYMAVTGNATVLNLDEEWKGFTPYNASQPVSQTSTNGQLPSTITIPTASWGSGNQIGMMAHN